VTSGQRPTIVGVSRRPGFRLPEAAYYPPDAFVFICPEADRSAFDLWADRQFHLGILDTLRPREFLVLTSEVIP
jgi:hypothetical protein